MRTWKQVNRFVPQRNSWARIGHRNRKLAIRAALRAMGFFTRLLFVLLEIYLIANPSTRIAGFLCLPLLWFPTILARLRKEARYLETIAPMTRQNAASLPDAESLVRSSQANDIPQESVLLRPTRDGSHLPAEELLRPEPLASKASATEPGDS